MEDNIEMKINGSILKKNDQVFTELEKKQFLDKFIEFLESKDLQFVGITK